MTAAISARALRKRYRKHEVFDDLDLSVHYGETVAILGASGCGKSTLLRCVAGLVPLDGGELAVDGEIGFVFQEPRLMPWLTVERNVAFAARDAAEHARVKSVLELVGLANATHLLPKQLSGGMAQRAALARSLVRSPQILLLDEPLSALDALLRLELQTALVRIVAETRCTTLLVTHDVDEALYMADRIVVLAGAPAKTILEVPVPPWLRRSRYADATNERVTLLAALGVPGPASEGHPNVASARSATGRALERMRPE